MITGVLYSPVEDVLLEYPHLRLVRKWAGRSQDHCCKYSQPLR